MKRNILRLVSFLTAAALLTSCGKDFLDTTPSSSISPSTVFSTVDLAEGAINGINKLMTMQHGGDYGQGFNGEGTIKLYYGEYPGNNFSKPYMTGWSVIFNQQYHERTSSVYDSYPWYYYYRIIANANMIIENIDGAAGSPTRRDFVKAQALTFRAYAYTMLIQIYSKRWKDYHGDTPGVVLRLTSSTEDLPLSTQAEVYAQIYADLDQAIDLYTSSGEERTNGFDPDINVAYATYARAAITREDYTNGLKYAKLARNGYPLMTNAEYVTGAFATPNQEWIWYSYGAPDETLYYYSYQAYIAYNANSSAGRSYRSCISKQLFDSIPNTDMRKGLFINPSMWADQDPLTAGYQNAYFSQDWNYKSSSYVNQSYYIITNTTMANEVRNYIAAKFPYARSENGYVNVYEHCKIGSVEAPGVGCLNHFRSSEMLLIEAECDYALTDETGAQNALIELNKTSGRDLSYTCTKTGTRLFDEIVKYRGLELWGEGFDWFDCKRWGKSISRRSIANSGNFHTMMAVTIAPGDDNEWTWMIPQAETDYNTALE
jgi:starch-binding outer membrane protein, SusD/RagB family